MRADQKGARSTADEPSEVRGFRLEATSNVWLSGCGAGFRVESQGEKRLEQPLFYLPALVG